MMNSENVNAQEPSENRDPISHEAGAHPVGTGVGAAGAGVAGTVIGGLLGGPVGAVVGAAIGSVVGGLTGKGVAEKINPTEEDSYWQDNYTSRPYVEPNRTFDEYQPAYQTGYQAFDRYADTDKTYEEVEPELQADYEKNYAASGLPWERAKEATRDAWIKLYEERLVADKTRVKTGEVTVGKRVETETARVAVPVEKERVVVERVTPADAGTPVSPESVNFGGGAVTRMEVYEEKADISKEAVLREEVNVRKEVQHDTVQVEEQVRREELDVDAHGSPVTELPNTNPRKPLV